MKHSIAHKYTPRSYKRLLEFVKTRGHRSSPRGVGTTEVIDATMILRNPLDRVVTDPARKMNIAFGFAEWFSMLFGIDDIRFFTAFIKSYDQFSSDSATLDGCYGSRLQTLMPTPHLTEDLFMAYPKASQMQGVINELTRDPDSRRAIAVISRAGDIFGEGGRNMPCTMTMQFLIRDNKLHMITNMRSNDVVKGVTYDIFFFTLMQEFIARQLGVPVGTYMHHAASLHLYDTDLPLIDKVGDASRWPLLMMEMPQISPTDMYQFYSLGRMAVMREADYFSMSQHWQEEASQEWCTNVIATMGCFVNRQSNPELALRYYDLITDGSVKHVLRYWLTDIDSKRHRLYKEPPTHVE